MKRTTVLALTFAALAAIPAHANLVTLSFSPGPVYIGNTFTMTVSATDLGGDSFSAFGMNPFISDPTSALFLGAVVNPALNDDSAFFGGNPAIAGDAFPPISTVPIELATLTFQALKAGPVTIGVTSDLSDPNQGLFLLNSVQDLTASQGINLVPEPTMLVPLVLLLGGVCFGFRRRRSGCQID